MISFRESATLQTPDIKDGMAYDIPDTRDGYIRSAQYVVDMYTWKKHPAVAFHYNDVNDKAVLLLKKLHREMIEVLGGRGGEALTNDDVDRVTELVTYYIREIG